MTDPATTNEAHHLVAAVRAAAAAHRTTWEAMVPNMFQVNLEMEPVEEAAYDAMAEAKAALRRHICKTYGLSARELASLAAP